MKQCLRIFIMLSLAFIMNSAHAKDFEVDGIAYNVISISDLTCEVAKNNQYYSPSYIPAHVSFKGKNFKVLGVGEKAFDGSFISEVTLEKGITYIGNEAFKGCEFTRLTIPNTITQIGQCSFAYCGKSVKHFWNNDYDDIISELIIEDGTDMLEGELWLGNYSSFMDNKIKKLYLGRNINNALLKDALYTSLEEFTIGDLVTILNTNELIPSEIFGLSALQRLTIGSSLKMVPYFGEGDDLKEIYVRATTPQPSEGFNDGTYMHATLYVPKGTKADYEKADIWKNFWTIEEYNYETASINNITQKNSNKDASTYNLSGYKVTPNSRGILIKNGKKYINK